MGLGTSFKIEDFFSPMDPDVRKTMQEKASVYPSGPQANRISDIVTTVPTTDPELLGSGIHSFVPPFLGDQPVTPEVAELLSGGQKGRIEPVEKENGSNIKPKAPFIFDIKQASLLALQSRQGELTSKLQNNTITPDERQQLFDINNQLDALATESTSGAFSNQLMLSILPSIFSQQYQQSEQDRNYQTLLREESRRAEAQRAERQRETTDRQNAFGFAKSLLPNFDFSTLENELDPSLIPELIRYAMNQSQIASNRNQVEANRQNQRMAQPRIRMPA